MKKAVPPYLIGLPQWPGSTQTPATGQMLAEWHADKTVTVGTDTFVEDLGGDYFPLNGQPLKSYAMKLDGSYVDSGIKPADIIELEAEIYYTSSSTDNPDDVKYILGSKDAGGNIFSIRIRQDLFGNHNIGIHFGEINNGTHLIALPFELTGYARIKMYYNGTVPTTEMYSLDGTLIVTKTLDIPAVFPDFNIFLGALNDAGTAGSVAAGCLISKVKINGNTIYLNQPSSEQVTDDNGYAYQIQNFTNPWTEDNTFTNPLNYTGYKFASSSKGKAIGGTYFNLTDNTIVAKKLVGNDASCYTLGSKVPALTTTARVSQYFSNSVVAETSASYIPTGITFDELASPISYDFIWTNTGNLFGMILVDYDCANDIDWFYTEEEGWYFEIYLNGVTYATAVPADMSAYDDKPLRMTITNNSGEALLTLVSLTAAGVPEATILNAVSLGAGSWTALTVVTSEICVGCPLFHTGTDLEPSIILYTDDIALLRLTLNGETFYFDHEVGLNVIGSNGTLLTIQDPDTNWIEYGALYPSRFSSANPYRVSDGTEYLGNGSLCTENMIIPWDGVAATPKLSYCYESLEAEEADYIGRTQFPMKITGAGITPPECHEFYVLWNLLGAAWPSSILFAGIEKDQEDAHVLFFTNNGQFEGADAACAFLSKRTAITIPSLSQATGFVN